MDAACETEEKQGFAKDGVCVVNVCMDGWTLKMKKKKNTNKNNKKAYSCSLLVF